MCLFEQRISRTRFSSYEHSFVLVKPIRSNPLKVMKH